MLTVRFPMKLHRLIVPFAAAFAVTLSSVQAEEKTWLTFEGKDGPGKGKHVVLLAGDEEYRSEESLPMLAKILSQRLGFKATVLFSVEDNGTINPDKGDSLSNPEALGTCGRRRHVVALPALAGRSHGAF